MRYTLLTILFLLIPISLFSQNYEKEGDDLFAQAQYEQANKKYKAAIVVFGETPALKKKQTNSSWCATILMNAQTAEKEARYNDAAKYYSDLFSVHPLSEYQSKANALKKKAKSAPKKNNKVYDLVVGSYAGDADEPLHEIRTMGYSNAFVVAIVDDKGTLRNRVIAKRAYSKDEAIQVQNALKNKQIKSWIWQH